MCISPGRLTFKAIGHQQAIAMNALAHWKTLKVRAGIGPGSSCRPQNAVMVGMLWSGFHMVTFKEIYIQYIYIILYNIIWYMYGYDIQVWIYDILKVQCKSLQKPLRHFRDFCSLWGMNHSKYSNPWTGNSLADPPPVALVSQPNSLVLPLDEKIPEQVSPWWKVLPGFLFTDYVTLCHTMSLCGSDWLRSALAKIGPTPEWCWRPPWRWKSWCSCRWSTCWGPASLWETWIHTSYGSYGVPVMFHIEWEHLQASSESL